MFLILVALEVRLLSRLTSLVLLASFSLNFCTFVSDGFELTIDK